MRRVWIVDDDEEMKFPFSYVHFSDEVVSKLTLISFWRCVFFSQHETAVKGKTHKHFAYSVLTQPGMNRHQMLHRFALKHKYREPTSRTEDDK